MRNFVLKIIQALILSVFALVVLLNSELSQIKYEPQARNLDNLNLNASVSLAKPLR